MAIDRAPFNALVDDDGSNTTGTPWNKNAIKTVILDPVDAALAANVAPGAWTARPFVAANYFPEPPLTWTPIAAQVYFDRYTYVGNTLFWHLKVADITLGGAAGSHIHVKLPGTRLPVVASTLGIVDGFSNGAYSTHKIFVPVGTDVWIRRLDFSSINPGTFFAEFTAMIEVGP